jgi:hypothetical protein
MIKLPVRRAGILPRHALERPLLTLGLLLVLLLLMLVFAAHPVSADGIIIPQPPVDRPIPWRDIPLTVKYHRVDVTIDRSGRDDARDQVFVNEATSPSKGPTSFRCPKTRRSRASTCGSTARSSKASCSAAMRRGAFTRTSCAVSGPCAARIRGPRRVPGAHLPHPRARRASHRAHLHPGAQPRQWPRVHYRYPLNTEKFSARSLSEVSISVAISDRRRSARSTRPAHR